MRRSAAGLLLLASCGSGGPTNQSNEQSVGFFVTWESEDAVGAARPSLTLSCNGPARSLWLDLVRAPDQAPLPRGTFGAFKVDDGSPVRVELIWLGDSKWAPRLSDVNKAILVRAIAVGRNVYFTGPEGTTERAYRWDLERIGPRLADARRFCA